MKQDTLRYETPPGKQAQMDWAYVGKYLVDGQYKRYMPTHLAISFAVEAITQGYTALFLTADDLVAEVNLFPSCGIRRLASWVG